MSEFKELTWEQVKPVWDTYLWPGRDSEPVTSMMYLGGYNLHFKSEEPYFIGFVEGTEVVAVNSYVKTDVPKPDGYEWRSRGLWVHPKYRGCGHASSLLRYMIKHVWEMGGSMIWTMPRRGALEVYESVGFEKVTEWKKQDWGVNCYARKELLH